MTRLDLRENVAYARACETSHYSQPVEQESLNIIDCIQMAHTGGTTLHRGHVRVSKQVVGYTRRDSTTHDILSQEPLDLPTTLFDTQAFWFGVPTFAAAPTGLTSSALGGGLHAVEHTCIAILPLLAMGDRNDIGGLSTCTGPLKDTVDKVMLIYSPSP